MNIFNQIKKNSPLHHQPGKKGLVSIVIPTYNAADSIDRCLESILKQTYSNFEIILVDDGSADHTIEKLKFYQKKDPRLNFYSIEHGGVSKARNTGIHKATGEYLQFIDADDDIEPHCLEKMVGLIEKEQADLVICRFTHPLFRTYIEDKVYDLSNEHELLAVYRETFAFVVPWNRLWRKSCFTEVFDEEVHVAEDELCNLANLPNLKKIVTTKDVLYHYYYPESSDEPNNSCIKKILNTQKFWETKKSIYFQCAQLLPKRRHIIEQGLNNGKLSASKLEDMLYTRLIDFCFWQLPGYLGSGVPKEGLIIEFNNVFNDQNFILGFQSREQYGLSLKSMSIDEQHYNIKRFIDLCHQAFEEKGKLFEFNVVSVFIGIFIELFIKVTEPLHPAHQYAHNVWSLKQRKSQESQYTYSLLSS